VYLKSPVLVVGAEIVAVFPDEVNVCVAPLFNLYENVYGDVLFAPVNRITGLKPFLQTVSVPEILAVGDFTMVIVDVPV
jgi:hypothetical protein